MFFIYNLTLGPKGIHDIPYEKKNVDNISVA